MRIEDLTTTPSKVIEDECDVLINASGFLNNWSWPKISGIENFTKPKVHSARWDANLDLKDKVVGIIGNGSSAIQVRLPLLEPLAKLQAHSVARLSQKLQRVRLKFRPKKMACRLTNDFFQMRPS